MMDIIKPDSCEVTILGDKLSEATKNKLGYLPEERGLYRKLGTFDSIIYLASLKFASLKGMDKHSVIENKLKLYSAKQVLSNKRKKIGEMSKGMGQIIRFIVIIIHGFPSFPDTPYTPLAWLKPQLPYGRRDRQNVCHASAI